MSKKSRTKVIEIVDITTPALNSMLGKYFIGQTGVLNFGNNSFAWGGIINLENSGVNLYIDLFTITNFSSENFIGEVWLNAAPPEKAIPTTTITPSNQTISPVPMPKAKMEYASYLYTPLFQGVNIFGRIVAQNSTLVSDSHKGSIIVGPGGSFSILLKPLRPTAATGTIVITWWEDKI